MIAKRKSQPNPKVQTSFARRLEHVRNKIAGRIPLKEFHGRLAEVNTPDGEPFKASYSAARNYHYDTREPPASYLAQVAIVFGVRIEWLMTGIEPKSELIQVRATPSQIRDFRTHAESQGLRLSVWLREIAQREVRGSEARQTR